MISIGCFGCNINNLFLSNCGACLEVVFELNKEQPILVN